MGGEVGWGAGLSFETGFSTGCPLWVNGAGDGATPVRGGGQCNGARAFFAGTNERSRRREEADGPANARSVVRLVTSAATLSDRRFTPQTTVVFGKALLGGLPAAVFGDEFGAGTAGAEQGAGFESVLVEDFVARDEELKIPRRIGCL